MAKVKMPLMGVDAAGQLGKSMVFGNWRGVSYARTHVYPANPRTELQVQVRDCFTWINDLFKRLSSDVTEVWEAYAKGRALTSRNAFIKFNLAALREQEDITNLVISPGVGGGYPLASLQLTVNTAENSITAAATLPTLPAGWTVSKCVFFALEDQDPHGTLTVNPLVQVDTTSPYSVTFSGLTDGAQYLVSAFAVYVKPSGERAYGPSISSLSSAV